MEDRETSLVMNMCNFIERQNDAWLIDHGGLILLLEFDNEE